MTPMPPRYAGLRPWFRGAAAALPITVGGEKGPEIEPKERHNKTAGWGGAGTVFLTIDGRTLECTVSVTVTVKESQKWPAE